MDTINSELEKNGIKIICPISTLNINEISMAYDSFDSAYKLGFEDAKKFLIRFKRDIFGKLKFR